MNRSRDDDLVTAIERAYRDEYRRFLRVAVGVLGDLDQARDAVQETFARALRSRQDLRRIDSLDGWLWRTLTNVCLVEKRHVLGQIEPASVPAEGHADDEWPEVRELVAALPERQRLVLFLRHYADLDYRQIAEAAGIERGTVAAALHAAHQKLREAMAEVQR